MRRIKSPSDQKKLEITVYQDEKRQRGAIHSGDKIKDGFDNKTLRRIAIDRFEKFRLNFSKLSSVTEFLYDLYFAYDQKIY